MFSENVAVTDFNTFSTEICGDVGVVRLKKNFLLRTTDLAARDLILQHLERFAMNSAVKGILILGAADSKGRDEYLQFYREACRRGVDSDFLHRMLNVMNQIVLKIVTLDKIVVHANSGNVLPHFLSLALAADYTLFSDSALIQNPCLEIGMLPKGGIVYFLVRRFGKGKAMELLLSDRDITGSDAAVLGLVDQVVSADKLEDAALDAVHRFTRASSGMVWGIKKLINADHLDLARYIEYENKIFLQALRQARKIEDTWLA